MSREDKTAENTPPAWVDALLKALAPLTEIRDILNDIKIGQQELLNGQQELLNGQQKLLNGQQKLLNGQQKLLYGQQGLLKAPNVVAGVYFSRVGDIWDFALEECTGDFKDGVQRSKECPDYIVAVLNQRRSKGQAEVGQERVFSRY